MTSTLALSREKLEADGWHVETVEQVIRVPGKTWRKDLFGFADLLCLRGEDVLLVQATSYSNANARINKIADHENVGVVRKAGWSIHVHGWRKRAGKWECREVDVS